MFFAKITNYTSTKNRLQEYLSKQVKSLDCVTVSDPDTFKKHLETMVHRANLKFPRCRSLTTYYHTAYGEKSNYIVGIAEVVQISLYQQLGTFDALQSQPLTLPNEGQQATLFA